MNELEKAPIPFGLSTNKPENPFENQEAITLAILDYLAERGGSQASHDVEITDEEIEKELYAKFGVYDTAFAYEYWDNLKKVPTEIKNQTLRTIVEKVTADDEFDYSFVTRAITYVDTAWVPIRERLTALEAIPDGAERKRLLNELRVDIATILKVRKYSTYQRREEKILELSDLDYDRISAFRHLLAPAFTYTTSLKT